jgi:Zn-dependent protease with chaperone function
MPAKTAWINELRRPLHERSASEPRRKVGSAAIKKALVRTGTFTEHFWLFAHWRRTAMKMASLGLAAVCWFPVAATAADGERDEMRRGEAIQERSTSSRQHWLYDEENQPQTNASAPARQGCKSERVRVSRGDGTTAVIRIDKCR